MGKAKESQWPQLCLEVEKGQRPPDCGAQSSLFKCLQSLSEALTGEAELPNLAYDAPLILGPALLQPHLTPSLLL